MVVYAQDEGVHTMHRRMRTEMGAGRGGAGADGRHGRCVAGWRAERG
jgi:hypothetical protein